jgi:hypothetical protein
MLKDIIKEVDKLRKQKMLNKDYLAASKLAKIIKILKSIKE